MIDRLTETRASDADQYTLYAIDLPCGPKTGPLCIFSNIQKTTKDNYMIFGHIKASVY